MGRAKQIAATSPQYHPTKILLEVFDSGSSATT